MKVRSLKLEIANDIWSAKNAGEDYPLDEGKMDIIGEEEDILLSDLELDELKENLIDLQSKYSRTVSKVEGGKIDSELPEIVHGELRNLINVHQAAQIGFWRWMSNVACSGYFWEFIKWRFGSDQMINWGITSPGSIIEVYFYRAWLRGQKMYDPSDADPYKYARLGASDVWRSHILRQDFGRDREFVKAFLDTVYNSSGKVVIGTNEMRTKLIPALRAWTSSASFSHLSYNENLELIKYLREQGV